MNKKNENDSFSSKVDAAGKQAAGKVVERAKQTRTPVVVWEEGHIKEVPSDQIGTAAENDEENHE